MIARLNIKTRVFVQGTSRVVNMNERTKKPIHKRRKSTSLILHCIVLNLLARLKSNTVSYRIIDIKSLALDAVNI